MSNEIHTAIVHHKHGRDMFVARTVEDLDKKVYGFVEEYWFEFVDKKDYPDVIDDVQKAIEVYFDASDGQEWVEYMSARLDDGGDEPPPVIPIELHDQIVDLAKQKYHTTDTVVDEGKYALVREADNGYWVRGWFWVSLIEVVVPDERK